MPPKRKSNISYGPSEKREFHVYDKVFAKMRGYPPWPAKITNIPDTKIKSLKSKCEVYFYGSNQIGHCAFTDIHDYEANKDRFKDCCPSTSKLKITFIQALEEIENDNGPLLEEIDDGTVKKIAFDNSTEESSPPAKKKKMEKEKESDSGDMQDASVVEDSDGEDNESDETEHIQTEEEKEKSVPAEPTPTNKSKSRAPSTPAAQEEASGAPFSTSILRTECSMLALENIVKESVGIRSVNFEKAIAAIKSLLELDVTALMLKKNPEIVDTFQKLQRYAGNTVRSKLPESTRPTFDEHAAVVRNLATRVMDKFAALFDIPPSRTFIRHFRSELALFLKRIENMAAKDVTSLTQDV